ncbi:ribonuclease H-like domain-containing protein [Tanacetum coccineum]
MCQYFCDKKIGSLEFRCRCGGRFCWVHRFPEEHECRYDYKNEASDDFMINVSYYVPQPKKKQKSKRKQRKEAETAQAETEEEEHLNTPSNDPLPSGEDIEIASLKKRVSMLEKRRQLRTTRLQRFKKLGTARRVKSSNVGLGDQEDTFKQGRSIEDIDADAEVTLVNDQQNEDLMFDTGVLADDEVFVDVASSKKNEQSTKIDDREVTAAKIDELTLAQTLIEIKAAKPKVVYLTETGYYNK